MKKQDLYHQLPYPLKILAVSTWGAYLHWWRYGSKTDDLIKEYLEHDTWSSTELRKYQEEKLSTILHHAVTHIPYYKNYWALRRRKGDKASWETLENWPVLRKEEIRNNPPLFLDPNHGLLYQEHTSGSTGTPLTLYQSRKTLHQWYALYDARVRRWNGISKHERWAIIGGQLVTPFNQLKPPFWVWNHSLNQLYLSSYHISPASTKSYLSALTNHKINYIIAYPSALTVLANYAKEQQLDVPSLKVIISNAEPLYEYQRSVIGELFHCPVINTYGMSELVCGASECKQGSMHIWPEAGIIEVMDDENDDLICDNRVGRIITTGFINSDMPLIRYETGDRGSLSSSNCSCGCKFPLLGNIEGRTDDVIITPDGRKVGRLDPVFKTDIPIIEAQIIQEKLDRIRIKFVPGHGYQHDKILSRRLRERLGDIKIVLEPVENIQKGANGKFKAVISLIHKDNQK